MPFFDYMRELDLAATLDENGYDLFFHVPLAAGPALPFTVENLKEVCLHFGKGAGVMVWFNHYWEQIERNGKTFTDWPVYRENADYIQAVIGINRNGWHNDQRSPEGVRRKRGTQHQAIVRSKGGLMTMVLALTDALGNLVCFKLLPGQGSEIVGVYDLIEGLSFDAMLADIAFDSDHLCTELESRRGEVVIPAKRSCIKAIRMMKKPQMAASRRKTISARSKTLGASIPATARLITVTR